MINKVILFSFFVSLGSCFASHEELVHALQNKDFDTVSRHARPWGGLLYEAVCCCEDVEMMKYVLSFEGEEIEQRNQLHETPLMVAAKNGCERGVKFLVEHGANVNQLCYEEYAPLRMALVAWHHARENKDRYIPIIKLLIARGAIISEEDLSNPAINKVISNFNDSVQQDENLIDAFRNLELN